MTEANPSTAAAIEALRQHINGRLIGQGEVVDQVLIALLAAALASWRVGRRGGSH